MDETSSHVSTLTPQENATHQEIARISRGQRRINLIWELTQATVAVLTTLAKIYVSVWPPVGTSPEALNSAFFLIIGFYFGRTNHEKIGGVRHDRRGT